MAQKRAQLLQIDPEHPQPHRIKQAAARIEAGEIVVYPTDTIYGLAADIESRDAMEKLYRLRDLERTKPLSLITTSLSEVSRYAIVSNDCYRFMRRVLPGPYTFILGATKEVPKNMGFKKRRTVGIRIPKHAVALALAEALGRPLLTTSALDLERRSEADEGELFGLSDPIRLAEQYGNDAALVLDSGILRGSPSTVIDWSEDEPVVLRVGAGDVEGLPV
ncbi:MAG: threonylcarbamoyl-AMP synthase [Deltaproteobacteria bacterium]|nr:threonylcarbamoyl-AMP synthase [Deltaproteobacteria bacterium]